MTFEELINCNNTTEKIINNPNRSTVAYNLPTLYLPYSVKSKLTSLTFDPDNTFLNNYGAYYNEIDNIYYLVKDYNNTGKGANQSISGKFFYNYELFTINFNNYNVSRILINSREYENNQDKPFMYCPLQYMGTGRKLNQNFKIGSNYFEDLQYSNKSTDIITGIFYFLIPILIVIFLIKVFRKGIH